MSKPINSSYRLQSLAALAAEKESRYESQLNLSDISDSEHNSYGEEEIGMALNITMPPFHGAPGERADTWLTWFHNFVDAHNYRPEKKKQILPFYLKDHALAWFNSIGEEHKET